MTRTVAIVVFPGFQLLDVAGPIAAFEIAERTEDDTVPARDRFAFRMSRTRTTRYAYVRLTYWSSPIRRGMEDDKWHRLNPTSERSWSDDPRRSGPATSIC